MLTNPELSAAHGFDAAYIFAGTRADVTRQIGNSVSPHVAAAITAAIAAA
jgi:site-specific DNA-cytosine methylase